MQVVRRAGLLAAMALLPAMLCAHAPPAADGALR